MALTFGANTSDRVDGTNTGTDPVIFTVMGWVKFSSLATNKGIFTKNNLVVSTGAAAADVIHLGIGYSTTSMTANSVVGTLTTGAWQFFCYTGNSTSSLPLLFMGSLTSLPAQPSYGSHTTPVGTRNTDGGAVYRIGNLTSGVAAMTGAVAFIHFIDGTALTLGEVIGQWMQPRPVANTKVFMYCGFNGTGTQPDWSGHNNSGTVTGATVSPNAPLPSAFAS